MAARRAGARAALPARPAGPPERGRQSGAARAPPQPLGGLAACLASRTQAVRFVFDAEALEVMTADGDWWIGAIGDCVGAFPSNYVCPREQAPAASKGVQR